MLPHQPTVSVILPVYNGGDYVDLAVSSIVQQSFDDLELLICDDGSTDGTTERIREFEHEDPRIRVIYWQANQGISAAQNALIDLARGQYIACMNQDDISLPERIGTQLKEFPQDAPTTVMTGSCELIDRHGNKLGEYTPPARDFRFHMRFRNPFVHPLLFTRTKLMRSFKYRDIPYAQDYDLWFRMMNEGISFHVCKKPLLQYRLHQENLTNPERVFAQMMAAMWIRNLIRTGESESRPSDLDAFRQRYNIQDFLDRWPVYRSCIDKHKLSKRFGLSLILNYGRFDSAMKAEVRNSIRYRLASLLR